MIGVAIYVLLTFNASWRRGWDYLAYFPVPSGLLAAFVYISACDILRQAGWAPFFIIIAGLVLIALIYMNIYKFKA